jgi:hypothetical protein
MYKGTTWWRRNPPGMVSVTWGMSTVAKEIRVCSYLRWSALELPLGGVERAGERIGVQRGCGGVTGSGGGDWGRPGSLTRGANGPETEDERDDLVRSLGERTGSRGSEAESEAEVVSGAGSELVLGESG